MTLSQMRLPWALRDPAFLRRKQAIARATTAEQLTEIMSVPLVADRAFEAYTHCPLGHMGEHHGLPPVNYNGAPHAPRECAEPACDATWLEALR